MSISQLEALFAGSAIRSQSNKNTAATIISPPTPAGRQAAAKRGPDAGGWRLARKCSCALAMRLIARLMTCRCPNPPDCGLRPGTRPSTTRGDRRFLDRPCSLDDWSRPPHSDPQKWPSPVYDTVHQAGTLPQRTVCLRGLAPGWASPEATAWPIVFQSRVELAAVGGLLFYSAACGRRSAACGLAGISPRLFREAF